MGGAQSVHDKIREQDERIAEWERTSTSTTQAPPLIFHDEADLSVSNEINHESADVTLDQSNHGFSFINLHWASFSTGLSSVLFVLISLGLTAGCCYVQGRRQRQSLTRHTEVLRTIPRRHERDQHQPTTAVGRLPGTFSVPSALRR